MKHSEEISYREILYIVKYIRNLFNRFVILIVCNLNHNVTVKIMGLCLIIHSPTSFRAAVQHGKKGDRRLCAIA